MHERKFLVPLILVLAGILIFHYDLLLKDLPPLIEKSCQFFSFFCLTIGIGWLYTSAHGNPKRAVLKILDWTLIGFILCMMPVFEILGLPPIFCTPLLAASLFARWFIAWWIKR